MNKYKEIDLENWKRRKTFEYFQGFDKPCFNMTVKLNGKNLYKYSKEYNESFFLIALYAIAKATNNIPQFRQRVMNKKVVEFEKISVMTPIMTKDEIFHQVFCEYYESFAEFKANIIPKIELAKNDTPEEFELDADDFICASCIPWVHFEAMEQAELSFFQSTSILAWGKIENDLIPVACKFDHSFIDGFFSAKYFNLIQEYFNTPEEL